MTPRARHRRRDRFLRRRWQRRENGRLQPTVSAWYHPVTVAGRADVLRVMRVSEPRGDSLDARLVSREAGFTAWSSEGLDWRLCFSLIAGTMEHYDAVADATWDELAGECAAALGLPGA